MAERGKTIGSSSFWGLISGARASIGRATGEVRKRVESIRDSLYRIAGREVKRKPQEMDAVKDAKTFQADIQKSDVIQEREAILKAEEARQKAAERDEIGRLRAENELLRQQVAMLAGKAQRWDEVHAEAEMARGAQRAREQRMREAPVEEEEPETPK